MTIAALVALGAESQGSDGDLVADYGKHTWSGQQATNDVSFIKATSHRTPAIFGSDFMNYSPSVASSVAS